MKLIIQNGKVVATATDEYNEAGEFITAPEDYDPEINYDVVNGELIVPVPQVVSMRQARLALLDAGLLSQIPIAIDQLEGDDKLRAEIEFEYGAIVERNSPTLSAVLLALGQTEEQIDTLFWEASKK